MSIERVRAHLAQFGAEGRIREFEESSATVELAAAAVGTEPARIAKTLSFMVGETPTLVLFAGDARVNNQAFKATFRAKPKMLSADQAEQLIGHAVSRPSGPRRAAPTPPSSSPSTSSSASPAPSAGWTSPRAGETKNCRRLAARGRHAPVLLANALHLSDYGQLRTHGSA